MLKLLIRKLVLDIRWGRLRLLPPLVLAGYLVFGQLVGSSPGLGWRIVAFVGIGLLVLGGAWPLPVVLGEAALLAVAPTAPYGATAAMSLLAALALLELAIRRPLPQVVAGALALGVAYLVASYLIARANGYGLAVAVKFVDTVVGWLGVTGGIVVPVLLGALLRLVLLQAKERHLRNLRGVRQAERTEIARELHDLVAHHVASMALRVGVARAVVPDLDPRVGAVLDDVHSSARTALADLRRLVAMLRTGDKGTRVAHVDPAELPTAVAEVIDRGTQAGLDVAGHVDPAIATLDSVHGLAVLRVVQEGVTNVAKHTAGAHATVRVDLLDGDVRVEVTDDGGAPDRPLPLPATGTGYGLVGLRERVEVLGGTLTAGPWETGWRLRATFPAERP